MTVKDLREALVGRKDEDLVLLLTKKQYLRNLEFAPPSRDEECMRINAENVVLQAGSYWDWAVREDV